MELTNWDEVLLPYGQAVDELMVKFKSLANGYSRMDSISPIEQVDGRVKRVSSILEKANRKGIPINLISEKIEDIGGIRIICRFIGDIEKVIELIRVRNGVDLEISTERDYITKRKSSGYRSYHVIIKYPVITVTGYSRVLCEIQIRTLAMNFWATIEHSLRYKYQGRLPEHLHQRLIASSEAAAKLDSELNEIRDEILDAQTSYKNKTELIDEILAGIQALSYNSKVEYASDINDQFFSLYESGDYDGLIELNRKLKLMTDTHKKSPHRRRDD